MAKETAHIPLEEFATDARAIFERVAATRKSVVVERSDGVSAVLRPTPPRRHLAAGRAISTADHKAFLESAGGWADVDTDALKRDIDESRNLPPRPPVEL